MFGMWIVLTLFHTSGILCFLPGWDEIKDATRQVEEEADPDLRSKIVILPLHSSIPHEDQQKVFYPAEDGTIKVILSTNIAESSVTIDDVLAVIDGGLVRELSFDAESAMSMMDTVAVSKASATQRLGRAGRVAPGACYYKFQFICNKCENSPSFEKGRKVFCESKMGRIVFKR
jgi:HrpA-like RNA helicase